ncbi:MAG: DNA translocase FtsK 4TM domain-containing protein [SAR324 cluster bacterium]
MSRRRIGLTAGLAAAAAVLGAVCSFAPQDPTFINLRYPKDGIANWLGYPGALAGGSLVEAFGWAALLVPAAIAYWTLNPVGRPRGWRYAAQTAALLLLAGAWGAQGSPDPGLGLASAGLIGWCGADWVRSTLGPWAGFILLTVGLALALWHQLYAPGLRSALKQFPAARQLFTRAGRARAQAWLRARVRMARAGPAAGRRAGMVIAAAAPAVLAPVQALGALLLGAGLVLRRSVAAPLAGLAAQMRGSAASLRDIRTRTALRPFRPRRPAARSGQAASRNVRASDGWLRDEPEPEARVADAQAAAPASAASQPGGYDGFEHLPSKHPAQVPWHDENALRPDPSPVPPAVPPPGGAQWMAEASRSAERLRPTLAQGADSTAEPQELARSADSTVRGVDGTEHSGDDSSERLRRAGRALARGADSTVRGEDNTVVDALGAEATGGGPTEAALPGGAKIPPEGEGRERWERLLRRYRDNLDPDWDEHGWRAHDERGPRENGAAKPRSPR